MQVSVMIIYYSRGHGLTTQVLWQHDPPGHSKCSVHLLKGPLPLISFCTCLLSFFRFFMSLIFMLFSLLLIQYR